jgi:hypothetical protein
VRPVLDGALQVLRAATLQLQREWRRELVDARRRALEAGREVAQARSQARRSGEVLEGPTEHAAAGAGGQAHGRSARMANTVLYNSLAAEVLAESTPVRRGEGRPHLMARPHTRTPNMGRRMPTAGNAVPRCA